MEEAHARCLTRALRWLSITVCSCIRSAHSMQELGFEELIEPVLTRLARARRSSDHLELATLNGVTVQREAEDRGPEVLGRQVAGRTEEDNSHELLAFFHLGWFVGVEDYGSGVQRGVCSDATRSSGCDCNEHHREPHRSHAWGVDFSHRGQASPNLRVKCKEYRECTSPLYQRLYQCVAIYLCNISATRSATCTPLRTHSLTHSSQKVFHVDAVSARTHARRLFPTHQTLWVLVVRVVVRKR